MRAFFKKQYHILLKLNFRQIQFHRKYILQFMQEIPIFLLSQDEREHLKQT